MDFNHKEIVETLSNKTSDDRLFQTADKTREDFVGNEVHLRALIEFSNPCARNCAYCGLRKDNEKIERYSLKPETIVQFAKDAVNIGYRTVVLQSGEGIYPNDKLVEIVREIKKIGVDITLSVGEKTYEEYARLKEAGADRYLLRIETTDEKLYKKLHPDMDFKNRVRCLQDIKKLGFEAGTGTLVGLPGQSVESLANDLLFFKELDADMIGIGPFIPNPDTPLGEARGENFELALKMMALTRLLLPDINIPATTAMETLHPQGRIIALQSGANVLMPNVTQNEYRQKYQIYPNKTSLNDRNVIIKKIDEIGRRVSDEPGKSKRFLKRTK